MENVDRYWMADLVILREQLTPSFWHNQVEKIWSLRSDITQRINKLVSEWEKEMSLEEAVKDSSKRHL